MKRYIFPEDIKYTNACCGQLILNSKEDTKKVVNFLNEVECNFIVRYPYTIELRDAELVPAYLYDNRQEDSWDFLILIIE